MIEECKVLDFWRNFRCGATVTFIGQRATTFPLLCGKWSCPACKKRKGKEAQAKVEAFAGIFVYTADLELVGKKLTLWIRRNLKSGKYLRLKLPERTVIIAEKSFPDCRRREKRKSLSELPGLLAGVECGRVISMRRHKRQDGGDKVKRIKYGLFNGDHQIEFNALRSEFERARWLSEQKGGKLLPDGDELVRRYRNGELQPDKPKSAAPWRCELDEEEKERLAIMVHDGGLSERDAMQQIRKG